MPKRTLLPATAGLAVTILLAGCVTGGGDAYQTTSLTNRFSVSSEALAAAQTKCNTLYADGGLEVLKAKMAIRSTDVPTREMIALNEGPTESEITAIKKVEEIRQTCLSMFKEAGYTTTAGQDIMEARMSRLRYGLYKGEIPYAVYNYGFAQALREQVEYDHMSSVAYSEGQALGAQRFAQSLQQMQTQMQMQAQQQQINALEYFEITTSEIEVLDLLATEVPPHTHARTRARNALRT